MAGDIAAYGGLFAVAFLAATILPAQSEIGLAGLLLSGDYSVALLIAVASLGNTLGAVVNWALGRWVEHFRDRKWFPAKPEQLDKAVGAVLEFSCAGRGGEDRQIPDRKWDYIEPALNRGWINSKYRRDSAAS